MNQEIDAFVINLIERARIYERGYIEEIAFYAGYSDEEGKKMADAHFDAILKHWEQLKDDQNLDTWGDNFDRGL